MGQFPKNTVSRKLKFLAGEDAIIKIIGDAHIQKHIRKETYVLRTGRQRRCAAFLNVRSVAIDFCLYRLHRDGLSYCGEEPNMEIGPDEEMPEVVEKSKTLQVIEGTEEVEKMDGLLSLAMTGGDYEWI